MFVKPHIALNRVVLPDPFGPKMRDLPLKLALTPFRTGSWRHL